MGLMGVIVLFEWCTSFQFLCYKKTRYSLSNHNPRQDNMCPCMVLNLTSLQLKSAQYLSLQYLWCRFIEVEKLLYFFAVVFPLIFYFFIFALLVFNFNVHCVCSIATYKADLSLLIGSNFFTWDLIFYLSFFTLSSSICSMFAQLNLLIKNNAY